LEQSSYVFSPRSNSPCSAWRGAQWADTLRAVRDFPIIGSGLGTYAFNYPFYKTLRVKAVFDHAHNDYLELLSEGGVVGLGLCGWGIIRLATTTANVRSVFSYGGNLERHRKEMSGHPRKPQRHKP
jgi:hypothetical protein